jgi:pimeloyl-ACP methyl ester carboxylesterase
MIAERTKPKIRDTRRGSKKHQHTEHFIDVDGVKVRYIEAGQTNGGTPVVLLHGFQGGADLWYPFSFPALAGRYHVYALDLPGFGKSGDLEEYTKESYGRFVNAFLDRMGLGQVQLVGHSMGGIVAIGAAAEQPEAVERLVLIDSAGLPRSGPHWTAPVVMLTDRSTFHAKLYPTVLRLAAQSRAMKQCLHMIREDSVYPLLTKLSMPTLVVWGSRDRVIPLEHATLFARNIAHARLAIIRGAGHMPFYQKPTAFNKLVFGFLKNESRED